MEPNEPNAEIESPDVFKHMHEFPNPLNPQVSGGESMTAQQYVEAKRLRRSMEAPGLKPLDHRLKIDRFQSDYVPLTIYVNSERRVIGKVKIDGNLVTGYIDEIDVMKLNDVVSRNDLKHVSFGFHVTSFKGDYPGAMDISLVQESSPEPDVR